MTKCSECGIDKEAVAKDIIHLEDLIKKLMNVIDKDTQLNNWSSKLGEMVKAMDVPPYRDACSAIPEKEDA